MRDALGAVQSVLVLGGTSEIGLATVRRLVGERTRTVVLAARDTAAADEAAAGLRARGARVEVLAFDADDFESHPLLLDTAFDRAGDVDLVLVALGVLGDQEEAEHDAGAAVAVLRTNLVGAASVMTLAARRLVAQGHGTIAVLSSVAGERVRRSNYVYGASKAGLDGFSQGLGLALEGSGVHVTVVRPGFVTTKMTAGMDPPPLSTTPERVAEAIVEGVRSRAHTVWVPPALRFVMAGVRHLPRPVFRRLPF